MVLDAQDIRAVHWQMDTSDATMPSGAVVTDVGDLSQCIRHALSTRKGSVPLDPEMGLDLDAYRDRPMHVWHLFLAAEARSVLERDVPRILVTRLSARATDAASIVLDIHWRPTDDVAGEFVTQVELDG